MNDNVGCVRTIGDFYQNWFSVFTNLESVTGPLSPVTVANVNAALATVPSDITAGVNLNVGLLAPSVPPGIDNDTALTALNDATVLVATPTATLGITCIKTPPAGVNAVLDQCDTICDDTNQFIQAWTAVLQPTATPLQNLEQNAPIFDGVIAGMMNGGTGTAGGFQALRQMVAAKAGVSPNWPAFTGGADPLTAPLDDIWSYLENSVN